MTTYPAPICLGCCRFRAKSSGLTCSAFPDGIPAAILHSRVDHRYPIAGDHGLQHVWRDVQAQEYADLRFGPLDESIISFYGVVGSDLFAGLVSVNVKLGATESEARRLVLDLWPIVVLAGQLTSEAPPPA